MKKYYSRKELKKIATDYELLDLKNLVIWSVEGYKYFYIKDNYEDIIRASERVIEYCARNVLDDEEKKKFHLIQSRETINEDVENMKKLFNNCRSLNEKECMPKILYDKIKEVFLKTDKDLEYVDEHNDFTKLLLLAGSIEMHKEIIEESLNRKIYIINDEPIDKDLYEKEVTDRIISVINNNKLTSSKKTDVITSIDYIRDYELMINDRLNMSNYYGVDDAFDNKILTLNFN